MLGIRRCLGNVRLLSQSVVLCSQSAKLRLTPRFKLYGSQRQSSSSQRDPPTILALTLSNVWLFTKAFCFVHIINEYFLGITRCVGPSMNPIINSKGDIVLVEKISPRIDRYLYKRLKKMENAPFTRILLSIVDFFKMVINAGDVVICLSPIEKYLVCKRILAKGSTLAAIPVDVWVEEETLDIVTLVKDVRELPHSEESEAIEPEVSIDSHQPTWIETNKVRLSGRQLTMVSTTEVYVPPATVWLQGDNLHNSTDSRMYGPVPYALIKGRVLCRIWPLFDERSLVLPLASDPPYVDPSEPIRFVHRTMFHYIET